MKKQKAKKLRLSRDTLRSLQETRLRDADGAAAGKPSLVKPCTGDISVCFHCTV